MGGLDEFAVIRRLTGGRGQEELQQRLQVQVGIGDDAAVAALTPGRQLVMTCDTMVEQVHFKPETMSPADVGYKALASNISDIAAMGALPRYALVALSAPPAVPVEELDALYEGLYACAGEYGVAVVGGDTTSSPVLVVSVTLIGEVEPGRALLRRTAVPGDFVFVTGYPGCSAAGLHALLARAAGGGGPWSGAAEELPGCSGTLLRAHQRPAPQVRAGRLLLESGLCHALNDISDGLSSEAWEIAEASSVQLLLEADGIPLHPELLAYAAASGCDPLDWALNGGEDYQLIGTAPAAAAAALEEQFLQAGIPFFRIGEVLAPEAGGPEVRLRLSAGDARRLEKKGYNHFAEGRAAR